jgi:putative transposase
MNNLQQQARFDAFVRQFNTERPHEALAMKTPDKVYSRSPRPYRGSPDLSYPLHERDVVVTACGRICLHRKRVHTCLPVSASASRRSTRAVGSSSFMHYDLGFFDDETCRFEPVVNPFEAKVLPMSPV